MTADEGGGEGEETDDSGGGATAEEAEADGALLDPSYPVTEHPDFATSSDGQVTTSQSTLSDGYQCQ